MRRSVSYHDVVAHAGALVGNPKCHVQGIVKPLYLHVSHPSPLRWLPNQVAFVVISRRPRSIGLPTVRFQECEPTITALIGDEHFELWSGAIERAIRLLRREFVASPIAPGGGVDGVLSGAPKGAQANLTGS